MTVGLLPENTAFNGANCPAIIFSDKSIDEKFFIGLLNSSLISFFMNSICPKKLGGYFRYNAKNIAKIPIAKPNNETKESISSFVEKILEIKSKNSLENTYELQNQIDQLVYVLYGLTEEEIKIVEGGDG